MIAIVDHIMTFYGMRAKALSVLVANTEKVLKEFALDREKMADEHTEKLDSLVEDITTDVRDTFTRFWFQKERKQRKNEAMTDEQVKNLVDFANFTKTLAKDVRSLPTRFHELRGRKLDKELRQIETYVKKRLKEFDEALNETRSSEKWGCDIR